jgi:glycosyltransferase involved in cell wall biosynthesis
MLNIAVFSECYHPMRNGVVVSVASFTRVLTEMGHNVVVITARHPEQADGEANVIRFPSVTLPMRVRYPLAMPIATGEARRMLAETRFDIVHSHSPMLMGRAAINYSRRKRLPLVFTYHTLIEEYTHYVPLPQPWVRRQAVVASRFYCNTADHVIAPCRHVADRLRRYQVTKPISIIPTGIDIDLIDLVPRGRMREYYQIPHDVPLLAYAGRIAKEKNIPRVLTAFKILLRRMPDAHLLLLGGGPYEGAIHAAIEELGIADRTRITGFIPRELLIQGLREADIFTFASTTETQGLVLGEAMACAKPVVAVSADAPRELMDQGEEGYLVDDADAPFAEAVYTILNNAALAQTMGAKARLRAETISAYRCTEELLKVYEEEIGYRHPHRPTVAL